RQAADVRDTKVPAAIHRWGCGKHVRMTGRDRPGAVPAHRLAGEVDAFLVDGEAALRFRDAAHDVAIADAEILSVAASVRLDDDCGSRVRDRVVSSIDVPPADVLGIRGIEAVQECNLL